MGWGWIVIPEIYGGSEFGYLSLGLVLEQLGRNLVASPLASTAAAAPAIVLGGSEAAKVEWLPKIACGEVVATLAIDEGPVHNPARVATSVVDGKLTGTKEFVAEGDSAVLFVVSATDGLYLVSGDAGVSRSPRHMADSRSHAQVRFDGAEAEKLGGADLAEAVIDRATAALCAEMLGMAEQA